jgi:hypothetical protein
MLWDNLQKMLDVVQKYQVKAYEKLAKDKKAS